MVDFIREFPGPNAGYILELYDRYRQDPESVDPKTRAFFDRWQPPSELTSSTESWRSSGQIDLNKIVAVANLAQSIRTYGHLAAQLDPLGTPPPGDPSLEPGFYGLGEAELRSLPSSLVGGPVAERSKDVWETIEGLRKIYCSSIGYDYEHIHQPEERDWLRNAAETGRFRPPTVQTDVSALLERLTQVEVFERFLHRIFPGKTRFSIEGLDTLIPLLDEVIRGAVKSDICMIFIGMAHRGRLNVLAHIMQKPYSQILAEFKDPRGRFSPWDELGWTGDVKYHAGASEAVRGDDQDGTVKLIICMPPNPSHLEHVNPVVEGMGRAAQSQTNITGPPRLYPNAALPVLLHGDAAFPGQGVVAETLNLSRLPGYTTSGTVHIITNNQLGFTAEKGESRSTIYASDLAKGFKIPILHVNADDPEACLEAARTAFAYRDYFHSDFLIDLVGYRRYGHNEGDEPGFTQPHMYAVIKNHPTVRELWAKQLVDQGLIQPEYPARLVQEGMDALQGELERLKPDEALTEARPQAPPPGAARKVKTSVPLKRLKELNEGLLALPEDFHLNPKLERARKGRLDAFANPDEKTVDWATAEMLSFGTILQDGIAIRLSGEDVIRGTFSHRHASFYNIEVENVYTPLHSIPQAKASFEIINTPLTENALIGFEFGYNILAPDRLVIWEAQYGDFINVAQPELDEFLISARAKWGQTPSLVLLLPHGNEGQGPDHSSARLERFLKLAEEGSMRIANPTSAAQFFHLLRRQAALLTTDPLPLIVMTPKGLLRSPLYYSRPRDLSEGQWQTVVDDPQRQEHREQVRRVVLCTGRVWTDLVGNERYSQAQELAIVRVEQLHPFPLKDIQSILESYPSLEDVTWVQEEPRNMGVWDYARPRLREILENHWTLTYIGRPPSSSPAEGSYAWYQYNQESLIRHAYTHKDESQEDGVLMEKG